MAQTHPQACAARPRISGANYRQTKIQDPMDQGGGCEHQAVENGRRSKNFIAHVRHNGVIYTDQDRKEEIFTEAYEGLLGRAQARESGLNLDFLGIPAADLQDLEQMFTEKEVWSTIKELPTDRAPGPDGFIGAFYHRAWPIIKQDTMAVDRKSVV